jgi:hypothetical protein
MTDFDQMSPVSSCIYICANSRTYFDQTNFTSPVHLFCTMMKVFVRCKQIFVEMKVKLGDVYSFPSVTHPCLCAFKHVLVYMTFDVFKQKSQVIDCYTPLHNNPHTMDKWRWLQLIQCHNVQRAMSVYCELRGSVDPVHIQLNDGWVFWI